jgi:hypothetical protein
MKKRKNQKENQNTSVSALSRTVSRAALISSNLIRKNIGGKGKEGKEEGGGGITGK